MTSRGPVGQFCDAAQRGIVFRRTFMRHLLFRALRHPSERSVALNYRRQWSQSPPRRHFDLLYNAEFGVDEEDERAGHFGLHLDGRFCGYARQAKPALTSLSTLRPGDMDLALIERIDLVCTNPEYDQQGLLMAALVRFMLAAVWEDAPAARILITVPEGCRAEIDLAVLGEVVRPLTTDLSVEAWRWWLVRHPVGVDDTSDRPELYDLLDDHGEQWRRSSSISVLDSEKAMQWA